MIEARDSCAPRIDACPHRGHRGLGPRRLRKVPLEEDSVLSEFVQEWACVSLVAVRSEVIGPQSVDQNEKNIQIFAFSQRGDVIDGSKSPRIGNRIAVACVGIHRHDVQANNCKSSD